MDSPTEYLTLSEAAKFVPGRPSASAVWRYCRKGLLARNGERVYLEHLHASGGRVYTKKSWLDAFFEELVAADMMYFRATYPNGAADEAKRDERLPKLRTPKELLEGNERARRIFAIK